LLATACATPPAPQPEVVPTPVPQPAAAAPAGPSLGTVSVTASALNVRRDPSIDGEILQQAKRGEQMTVLASDESWIKVRTANGTTGWVSAAHVSRGGGAASRPSASRRKSGCPADSDFAFAKTPTLAFSEVRKPGMVVVDATVNVKGSVTSTKVISNTTGDETLAFLAVREIKSAEFTPPIRNCVPRTFIYTYKRTF
jgi:uncharacterized protein YgiM (DUF1202 family)